MVDLFGRHRSFPVSFHIHLFMLMNVYNVFYINHIHIVEVHIVLMQYERNIHR